VSFGTSTEWSCPLMYRVTILPPMAVLLRSRIAASVPRRRRFRLPSDARRHVRPHRSAFAAVPVVVVAVQKRCLGHYWEGYATKLPVLSKTNSKLNARRNLFSSARQHGRTIPLARRQRLLNTSRWSLPHAMDNCIRNSY